MTPFARLADALSDALPQTQCGRCGYPDCRSYAEAMAFDHAPINQCPPGGEEGVKRLARLTGRQATVLNPAHGHEVRLQMASIDEAWCIGCTLCLKACPVDCIVGAPKLMHTVVAAQCTGCELCLPACPVDCISLLPASDERTGWAAWSVSRADEARDRYAFHLAREKRDSLEQESKLSAATAGMQAASVGDLQEEAPLRPDRRGAIQAALARARAARRS